MGWPLSGEYRRLVAESGYSRSTVARRLPAVLALLAEVGGLFMTGRWGAVSGEGGRCGCVSGSGGGVVAVGGGGQLSLSVPEGLVVRRRLVFVCGPYRRFGCLLGQQRGWAGGAS